MVISLTYWWKEANYQQENVRKAVIKLNIKQVTMREKNKQLTKQFWVSSKVISWINTGSTRNSSLFPKKETLPFQ